MKAKWGSVIVLLLLLATGCRTYFERGIERTMPLYERTYELDREAFLSYLDSAAVDDWEGVWLMVGHDIYCLLAIERINSTQRNNFYTHRLRTWDVYCPFPFVEFEAGIVVGYLESGVYEDEKRMTIRRGFLDWRKDVETTVRLDNNRSHIILGKQRVTKGHFDEVGMKRIYPIRSREEKPYKVRYL